MRKVLILGGLGNGTVIANAITHAQRMGTTDLECAGFLNDRTPVGEYIEDYPVLGKVADAPRFQAEGYWFINTILRIDGQNERINLFEQLGIDDAHLATFVHPMAYVAPNVRMDPGTIIMPQACVSPGTHFGRGCLVMVAATIGHNNEIGEFTHIAAQACVGSYLKIGRGVHIGLNATVRENLTIGDYATLGMGAVLTKDMESHDIWVGNPAKFLRKAE